MGKVNYTFSELFNLYRLKSGLDTYAKLGQALADEGFVYEDTIFSKWKSGDRAPRDRDVVKALLKVFIKQEAINSIEEADRVLWSLNLRGLDADEIRSLALEHTSPVNSYSKYRPLIEPNVLFQNVNVTAENTRVICVEDIAIPELREYWKHQAWCAIADYYVKFSGGEQMPDEVYKVISIDKYELNNQVSTFIAITTDFVTGLDYLSGTLRLVCGKQDRTSEIEVMELYGVDDEWPHKKMGLTIGEIGELSRLVIPDWARHSTVSNLSQMQDLAYINGGKRELKLLYVTISSSMLSILEQAGIHVTKIQKSYYLHKEPNAETLYPYAYLASKYYRLYWEAYKPALYVFNEYGVASQILGLIAS
jgi:hypothetical protein